MKNKKTGILIGIILIIVIIIVGIIIKNVNEGKSENIILEEKQFLGAVEIKSEPNFILYITEKEKVSNIIFLNNESVKLLSNQRIEGKPIEKAIEKIVDIMKNNHSFESKEELKLINYENSSIFSKVQAELNKELVVYGIEKEIITDSTNFQEKLQELNIKEEKNTSSIKQLYQYSHKLLESNQK